MTNLPEDEKMSRTVRSLAGWLRVIREDFSDIRDKVQALQEDVTSIKAMLTRPDRVAEWLHSEGARQHQEHWVALDADEGRFLAVVDDLRDRRLWRARGALIIYVDPPEDERCGS